MVRLDDRLKKIKEDFVDYGSYFVINRGRQYGKTTTLRALEDYLKEDYIVASLDFQGLGAEKFADAPTFSRAFAKVLMRAFKISGLSELGELLEPLAVFAGKSDSRDLVLKKFAEYFHEIYGEKDGNFIEKYGRKFFLLYLKPIINGTGNYYIEAQLTDYLEYYRKDKGYLLSFNFNKNKKVGVSEIKTGGKTIIEAVV